jgi:hypothetical protein
MRRRLFAAASAISLLFCIGTLTIWLISNDESWEGGGLRVSEGLRVGMSGGWLALYNQSQPFFDGTIGVSSAFGPQPRWPDARSLRFPGFHYLHITWPGEWPGGTLWTFAIWLGYPLIITAILPAMWLMLAARNRWRSARNRCISCSYSLTGNTSGVCPECGTPVAGKAGVKA